MAKLKSLLPTLRERKRYLVFQILSEKKLDAKDVQTALDQALMKYGGSKMIAKAGMYFFKDRFADNKGILRVANAAVDEVKSAMMLITHINNVEVAFRSLGVSGMIKKAEHMR